MNFRKLKSYPIRAGNFLQSFLQFPHPNFLLEMILDLMICSSLQTKV